MFTDDSPSMVNDGMGRPTALQQPADEKLRQDDLGDH
jgi:hypothetical protein